MNVGSLFSGIGGIEIGFERAGFITEWFIEQDKYAQEILKKRFPKAKIYDDITKVDFRTIPKVSILTGGFPCQDISNAGKRVGIEGSRSSLWKHYLRAISTLRPKYAFIENVSALLGRGLDVVLCDLAEIGYDAEWHCVPASSVGALHQRDRIFIIAYPNSNREPDEPINDTTRQRELGSSNVSNASSIGQFCTHLGERRQDKDNKKWDSKKDQQEWGRWECESCKAGNDVSNTNEQGLERNDDKRLQDGLSKQSHKSSKNVENSKCNRSNKGNWEEIFRREKTTKHPDQSLSTSSNVSNTNKKSMWELGILQGKSTTHGLWAVEPSVGRVADGIPNRVDRIKCLGNAVVPQVSEVFAEAIKKDAENGGKK